ncbi:MAG: ribonuclease HII [Acidilobaceae archaeon]
MGVDEAGRGSLIGELFVAAFALKEGDRDLLLDLGVRDSKRLTPRRRAELYAILKSRPFAVYSVSPSLIDRFNINKLTEMAAYEVLRILSRRLGEDFRNARIVIDRFGEVRELPQKLKGIGFKGELIVEERADANYVEVSAASIIAKHLRDRRLRVLKSLYGVKGSGYPSDPRTVEWAGDALKAGLKPPIIRYTWATMERLGLKARGRRGLRHKTLDEYLDKGIEG